MKILFPIIFLSLFSLLSACGNDEEPMTNPAICTQEDWVGRYTGSEDCSGSNGDVSMAISALDEDLIISFRSTTTEITLPAATLDGCKVTLLQEQLSVNGTLDGDVIVLNTIIFGAECTYTADRI